MSPEVSNMLHYKRMKMCHRESDKDIMISIDVMI